MAPADPNLPDDNFDDIDMVDQDIPLDDYDDLSDDDLNDFDADSPVVAAPPAARKPRKKNSIFTVVVIGIAIVIGGFILAAQLGKGPPSAPQVAQIDPNQAPPAEPVQPPAATGSTDANAPPDSLAGLQSLDQQQAQQGGIPPSAAPATAAQTANQQGFMNDPAQLDQTMMTTPANPTASDPANTPLGNQPSGTSSGNQNLPSIEQIKKADLPTPSPAVAGPAVTGNNASDQAGAGDQALQAKLDTVLQRLDSLEEKLAHQPAPAANPANTDISALRSDLDRLASKVDRLTLSSEAPVSAKPVSTPRFRPKVVKSQKASIKSKSRMAAPGWELRSAQPGQAMVARADGNDLKIVRIGDTIAGIGQITGISQLGDKWLVTGTSGRITE